MLAFQRILIVSAALFLPAAVSAAGMTQEPDSPFTKGKDVEWTEAHIGGSSVPPEMHREYHREAESKHAAWHAEHADMDHASGEYIRLHRMYHQQMNEAHRKFHRGLTDEDEGFTPGSAWEQTDWAVIGTQEEVSRVFHVERKSRRTLLKEVQQRNAEAARNR